MEWRRGRRQCWASLGGVTLRQQVEPFKMRAVKGKGYSGRPTALWTRRRRKKRRRRRTRKKKRRRKRRRTRTRTRT